MSPERSSSTASLSCPIPQETSADPGDETGEEEDDNDDGHDHWSQVVSTHHGNLVLTNYQLHAEHCFITFHINSATTLHL